MADETKKKVLVIGSGPIKIAEAAEFDYSGSQALRVLREEGFESILVNPNVATVQTSYEMADKVYLLPVSSDFVEKVIAKERPWGIMVGFGGQTALSVGVELDERGVFKKYDVKVLGTSIEGIKRALSREKFKKTMNEVGVPIPPGMTASSKEAAVIAANSIGYPVMLRVSFNLGGRGSAILWNEKQLKDEMTRAFAQSGVGEILIEKYLHGWKEVEYEVVRDFMGNCAVTACIENMDPMGVHTGESAVVTPAQTLDNYEYQRMRTTAIKVAESIDLVGECNVQFALDPKSYDFFVIEANPRMSRSSALASKATGYPLAYISAKLAFQHRLYEIKNSVSKATTAFFEPSLDYITVKIPRWNLTKFSMAKNSLDTEMKSIGEVMSIGRNFEEAFQKAIRMLDIGGEHGLVGGDIYNSGMTIAEVKDAILKRRPYWFLYVAKAFKEGLSVDEMYELTLVDRFFLNKIESMVKEYELSKQKTDIDSYQALKKKGFSDEQLGRSMDKKLYVKQIDTLAGEWPAKTNYLYTTYNAISDDISADEGKPKKKLLVLGAGVFRIGVSVEFDFCAAALAESAKQYFDEISMLNCNPETVSTDWDRVDKLYFDELTEETVLGICKKEKFERVATFAGGQIGNNLSLPLEKKGIKLLGTTGSSIDKAENRDSFSALLEKLNIKQADWIEASSVKDIERFIEKFGFPVLVRPSYVLSGSSMKMASNMKELLEFVEIAARISPKHPVTISRFIKYGIETELDCATDGSNVIGISMHHIEEAGVHSGDATIMTPYRNGADGKMKEIALSLVNELDMRGPFNLQFIVERDEPHVIELNLRASRSIPFCSKSVGINLIDYAMKGIFGKYSWDGFYEPEHKAIAVKSAQFSWSQLKGAYPHLGPEMRSIGESAALGRTLESALIKSWLGVQPNHVPKRGAIVYGDVDEGILKEAADKLAQSIDVCTLAQAPIEGYAQLEPDKAIERIKDGRIDIVMTNNDFRSVDYALRRSAADLNVPLVLNARLGRALSGAFSIGEPDSDELKSYW
jgi:carbamoyl-phosphate synthase large subunit